MNLKILKSNNLNLTSIQKIEDFIGSCHDDLKGLDILVNNAGITSDNISLRMSEEEWKKVLDINLTSTFLMCKYAIKKC